MAEKNEKRGRPRSFDPDDVLDKVIDVFWEMGYDGADIQTLCKRTALSKPSLYNAFGPKEDLFVSALRRYRTTRSKAMIDALVRAQTPIEGVKHYFLQLADNIAASDRPKGCLMLCVALPLIDRLPKVAAEFFAAPKESHAGMMAFFTDQIRKGNLPENFDTTAATSLIGDLGSAMIVQARAGVPREKLGSIATRNAELVLHLGLRLAAH